MATLFDQQSDAIMQAAQIQAQAISNAAAIQQQMAREALEFQKEQSQIARDTLKPFVEAGSAGTDQLQALLGIKGFAAEQQAAQNVIQGGAFQESVNFGLQALEKSAAARGGLQSGRLATELQQFGQLQGANAIQQRIGNLQNLSGIGVGAAGGSANIAFNTGAQGSNILNALGKDLGNFALGSGQVAASSQLATSPAAEYAFNLARVQANPQGMLMAGGLGGQMGALGGTGRGGFV